MYMVYTQAYKGSCATLRIFFLAVATFAHRNTKRVVYYNYGIMINFSRSSSVVSRLQADMEDITVLK